MDFKRSNYYDSFWELVKQPVSIIGGAGTVSLSYTLTSDL